MTSEIGQLNAQFAITGHVSFVEGPGNLSLIRVHNAHATATIALQGGNVTGYQPHGQAPVLFVSQQSRE